MVTLGPILAGRRRTPPIPEEKVQEIVRAMLHEKPERAASGACFAARDPEQIRCAEQDPKRRMALAFSWYLGLASRWANTGEPGRELDYQVWCGPAIGAFNDWARGTRFEAPEGRRVANVARALMEGVAELLRLRQLDGNGMP